MSIINPIQTYTINYDLTGQASLGNIVNFYTIIEIDTTTFTNFAYNFTPFDNYNPSPTNPSPSWLLNFWVYCNDKLVINLSELTNMQLESTTPDAPFNNSPYEVSPSPLGAQFVAAGSDCSMESNELPNNLIFTITNTILGITGDINNAPISSVTLNPNPYSTSYVLTYTATGPGSSISPPGITSVAIILNTENSNFINFFNFPFTGPSLPATYNNIIEDTFYSPAMPYNRGWLTDFFFLINDTPVERYPVNPYTGPTGPYDRDSLVQFATLSNTPFYPFNPTGPTYTADLGVVFSSYPFGEPSPPQFIGAGSGFNTLSSEGFIFDGINPILFNLENLQLTNISEFIPPSPICFKEDSQILCLKNDKEIYLPIQILRKGDLVKTLNDGYVPIDMIGTSKFYNLESNEKRKRLYTCPKSNYPELFEDLIITGDHSILVNKLTDEQREKTLELFGTVFITNGKSRLFAFLDERTELYEKTGVFNIYHIALENEEYRCNYGIYANGLLVESCSKVCLKEKSGMTLLE